MAERPRSCSSETTKRATASWRGGKPPGQLQRESAPREERRFHVLDPVRQFDARLERWRHREPFVDFGGFALRAINRIEQRGATPLFQSGARQPRYVVDRCTPQAVEPVGETVRCRQYAQRYARQCMRKGPLSECNATTGARDEPGCLCGRCNRSRARHAKVCNRATDARAKRAQAAEKPHAGGHIRENNASIDSIAISVGTHSALSGEADCTPINGLVEHYRCRCPGLDSNRAAGLHPGIGEYTTCSACGILEFACCRSDLLLSLPLRPGLRSHAFT